MSDGFSKPVQIRTTHFGELTTDNMTGMVLAISDDIGQTMLKVWLMPTVRDRKCKGAAIDEAHWNRLLNIAEASNALGQSTVVAWRDQEDLWHLADVQTYALNEANVVHQIHLANASPARAAA